MLAIDTNILVRLIVTDDARQARAARALLDSEDVLVSSTVLLESEWVLRRGFGLDKLEVLRVLTDICGLPHVNVAEPDKVAAALGLAAAGMDFADALHLAGATECEAFVTFDRKMAKSASGSERPDVRLL